MVLVIDLNEGKLSGTARAGDIKQYGLLEASKMYKEEGNKK